MRLWFCAPSMKSRLTCHRAVSPKITPYRGLLICCLLRYLVALHSALSLNSGIVTLISFLQEVTLGHPKRNIKNHAVMFWNATFAHAQTLKYPENLRYGRLFSSAIGLSGCTLQSITCVLFPFADQFFRLPKKKCHLLCQAGKTSRYDNAHSLFQSNVKGAFCWLVRDGPLFFREVSLGNFLTFRLLSHTQDLDITKHLLYFFIMAPMGKCLSPPKK